MINLETHLSIRTIPSSSTAASGEVLAPRFEWSVANAHAVLLNSWAVFQLNKIYVSIKKKVNRNNAMNNHIRAHA